MLGPGFSFGGSKTLSLRRAMCGTKANRLEGSVAMACAPGGVASSSRGGAATPPVRPERHHRGPARGRHLGLRSEVAGVGSHGKDHDLVLVLKADIHRVWH